MKWGMIATWRMALEGVEAAADMLKEGGNSSDAVESAVAMVYDANLTEITIALGIEMK